MRSPLLVLLAFTLATFPLATPSRAQLGGGGHDETTEDLTNTVTSWNTTAGQAATPGTVPAGVTGTHLLISEIGVRGINNATLGDSTEFIEIYNPTAATVDLSSFYISDVNGYAALPDIGRVDLAAVVTDFAFRFPAGSSIGPGQVKVIAVDGGRYRRGTGVNADFMLFNAGGATTAQKMVDIGTNKSTNYPGFGSLTNGGEFVWLFSWNGQSDLVCDEDFVYWGTPLGSNAPVRKTTATCLDGPDADPTMSCYRDDAGNPAGSFGKGLGAPPANGAGTRQRKGPETEPVTSGGNGCMACTQIVLSPSSLPAATAGEAYQDTLLPSGGTPPFTFTSKGGSLPPGLHLTGSTGVLYGCDQNGAIFTIDLSTGLGTATGVYVPTGLADEIEHDFITGATFEQHGYGGFNGQQFDIFTGAPLGPFVYDGGWFQGLEYVGSTLYGTFVSYYTGPSTLAILDPATGATTMIGPTGRGSISGLAYDAGTGTMYGIDGGGGLGPGNLLTLDLGTGVASVVGPVGFTPASLEFGPDGNLYAGGDGGNGGYLYRVNRLTGSSTLVGPTGHISVNGLTLGPGITGATGAIAGIPTAVGSFPFTVNLTDALGCAGSAAYKIDVSCGTLAISPDSLPPATAGSFYNVLLTASGSPPFVFEVKGGSLPPGMQLNPYGLLDGYPGLTGSFPITVSVTDSNGCSGTRDYKLDVVCPVIAILPEALPNASLGDPYSAVLIANGRPPLLFDVKGGDLPPGMSLDPGGEISGTPTATGSFPFTVGVTDSNGCRGTRDYKLRTIVCPHIAISPASLPAATVKQPYHEILTPSDGTPPFVFTVKDSSLPPGLRLSGSGTVLYGCDPGGAIFTVDLSTGAGAYTGVYAPIGSATEIEHDFLSGATFVQGRDGSFSGQRFDISNGVPIGGSIFDGGSFQGLEYVGSTLYGTSVTSPGGSSTLSILDPMTGISTAIGPTGRGPISGLAYDAGSGIMYGIDGGAFQGPANLLTLDLTTGAATVVGPTGFTSGSLEFGPDGNLYAGGDGSNGGNLYRVDPLTGAGTLVGPTGFYAVTGLTLGPGGPGATGLLSGIPTAGGSFTITLNVTDADGCRGEITYKLDISCPLVTLGPASLPPGQVGELYGQSVTASGGSPPYVYSVGAGSLPPGLALVPGGLGDAVISGRPGAEGKFTFTIHAEDNNHCSGDREYSILVSCPEIALTPATLPDGITQMTYSQILAPTAGSPPFSVVVKGGALPPGLSLKEQPRVFAGGRGRAGARIVAARSAGGAFAPRAAAGPPLTGEPAAPGPISNSLTVASDSTKGPRMLFALADLDDPAYRAQIAALIGGTVDFFQCAGAFGGSTPPPELLATYDCVLTKPNNMYVDRVLLGDRLADYVDGGGKVILGVFCALDESLYPGYALQGRIMTPAYCPVAAIPGTGILGRADYAGDGTTCLHAGVVSYGVNFHDRLALQGGGAADGHYLQDSSIAHAYRPDGRVIYSNGHGHPGYGATGDWARLLANACACDPHPVQIVISGTPTQPGIFNFTLTFTDGNGCSGEQDFTIRVLDQATPTLLSLFQARPVDDGLELRWQFGDGQGFSAVELERGATALGPWTPVAGERREENGMTVFLDRGVEFGRTYYYRLVATDAAGVTTRFGPFAQTAGQAIAEFTLGSPSPNPSAGEMRIDFAVARAAVVRLSVLDVMGREVAVLADGLRPPGRYQATWSGAGARGLAPAGLYFVRYRTPEKSFMKRAVVTR